MRSALKTPSQLCVDAIECYIKYLWHFGVQANIISSVILVHRQRK